MARPIKDTPTLYGKDARNLEYNMRHPKPINIQDVIEAKESYNKVISIAKFTF